MSMPSNIEAQGVANAISQERVHQTVSFPRTGDAETDCIIGFLRVAQELGITAGTMNRILKYISERYQWTEDTAKWDGQYESFTEIMKQMQSEQVKKLEDQKRKMMVPPAFGDPLWPGYTACNSSIPEIACPTGPGSGLANPGKTLCEVFEIETKEKIRNALKK